MYFPFIPLPAETTSKLPIHINGTFSLTDDCRSLKWPGKESESETASNWNRLLVEKVIPPCYALLLREALRHRIESEDFYDAIPDIESVSESIWEGLLQPLCCDIFELACFWCPEGRWIRKHEATFIPEESEVRETVRQVLGACGHHIVTLPSNMWRALELDSMSHSLKMVTPELARRASCKLTESLMSTKTMMKSLKSCNTAFRIQN